MNISKRAVPATWHSKELKRNYTIIVIFPYQELKEKTTS